MSADEAKRRDSADAKAGYVAWVDAYVARTKPVLGMCGSATAEMVKAFPELTRVPGHIYSICWGRRAHWWCVAPDGSIVDPTASQFPDLVAYEPWEPGTEVRVGRCMNCGEDIFARPTTLGELPPGTDTTFCNSQCADGMAKAVGW